MVKIYDKCRKYYLVYKTINKINGKIYIGQHQTDKLDDGYLGSGIILHRAIKKYGKDSFDRVILNICNNFEEMNILEKLLVDDEFIQDDKNYNIILGGAIWNSANTVAVLDSHDNIRKRVHIEEFKNNKDRYTVHSKGGIVVYDNDSICRRIPLDEYYKNIKLYKLPSTGRVSVQDLVDGSTKSINIEDFDAKRYKKCLGGIVANVDGKNQYVTEEFFIKENLRGVHVGKVTVTDSSDGVIKHITKNEYDSDPNRYKHLTVGKFTAYNTKTKEKKHITHEEFDKLEGDWVKSTYGERTVFDINLNKFINIPATEYDKTLHRLATDRKYSAIDTDGNKIFEFEGSKKDFLKKFNLPIRAYACAKNHEIFISDRKAQKYNNCLLKLEYCDFHSNLVILPPLFHTENSMNRTYNRKPS